MNINIYIENDLAKALDQQVKQSGQSRNAIIREAVKEYIIQHEVKKWPSSILNHQGIKDFPSFESNRKDLQPPKEDPIK